MDDFIGVIVWAVIIVAFILMKIKEVLVEMGGSGSGAERLQRLREFRRQLREGLEDAERQLPIIEDDEPEELTPAQAAAMMGGRRGRGSRSLARRFADGEEPTTAHQRTSNVERRNLGTLHPHELGVLDEFEHHVPDADSAYALDRDEDKPKGLRLPEGLTPAAQAMLMLEIFGPPRATRDYQSVDQQFSLKGLG